MNAVSPVRPPVNAPLALLAELTHRCPLQCPYCSNPTELIKVAGERDTAFWTGAFDEAAALGVLQVHLSGGEPTLRRDLETLIEHATARGLYTNLITSAVLLDAGRVRRFADAGLAHVQISIQGAEAETADRIGHYRGGHAKKLVIARAVAEAGMALTVNAVVHRQNLHQLGAMINLAVGLGAERLEVAHTQYHGWALRNRASLLPLPRQVAEADALVAEQRAALAGQLTIDYVSPDYYANRPKTCMGGWGQRFLNVTPDGRVLPCHAAETIPGLEFERLGDRPLAEIWRNGPAFERFRGTAWMQEPCVSCAFKEIDWGGCRCQAMALAGDANATDPVCGLSPLHASLGALAAEEAAAPAPEFAYRRFG
jgi:pyrroloquinoline quinone biosynthesis protein E